MSDQDDPVKLKRKEIEGRLERRKELADVAFVLSSEEGRRFYWRLMKRCGIHKSSMTGNNTTFFNEGERNIGLIMLAELEEADPEAYLKCLKAERRFVGQNETKGDDNA